MTSEPETNDEIYAGPSKTIETLGRANAFGWIGSIVGAIGGGTFAAFATKETSPRAKGITEWLAKHNLHISGKTAIVLASALATSQIVHWITYPIGLAHGKRRSGHGQEQFARIKAQRDEARGQIKALREERDLIREEYTDHFKTVHRDELEPPHESHAEAISNEKESLSEIAR